MTSASFDMNIINHFCRNVNRVPAEKFLSQTKYNFMYPYIYSARTAVFPRNRSRSAVLHPIFYRLRRYSSTATIARIMDAAVPMIERRFSNVIPSSFLVRRRYSIPYFPCLCNGSIIKYLFTQKDVLSPTGKNVFF